MSHWIETDKGLINLDHIVQICKGSNEIYFVQFLNSDDWIGGKGFEEIYFSSTEERDQFYRSLIFDLVHSQKRQNR